jgi:thioester reductase-like protein
MTDTEPKEPTKAEQDRLEKLAADYAKTKTKAPGYGYRAVPAGNGQSKWVAEKIVRTQGK